MQLGSLKNSLILLGLVFLSACGGENYQNFEDYNPQNYPSTSGSSTGESATEEALEFSKHPVSFHCSAGECVNGQAVLLTKNASLNTISSCTASLIDKNLVLTNEHCINDDAVGDQCPNTMIFLPALDDSSGAAIAEQGLHCKRIVSRSKNIMNGEKMSQDFALIEIDSPVTNRPYAKVSLAGVKDNESLKFTASMASVYGSTFYVRSDKHSCTAVMNNFVIPNYNQATDPVVGLAGCKTEHGNSGSSLINDHGEIVALIQAGFMGDRSALDRLFASFTDTAISDIPVPSTNLTCVDPLQKASAELKQACADRLKAKVQVKGNTIYARWAAMAGNLHSDSFDRSRFEWEWQPVVRSYPKAMLLVPTPKCFKSNQDWIKSAPTKGLFSSTTVVDFEFPKSFIVNFSEYLKFSLSEGPSKIKARIGFSQSGVIGLGGSVTLSYTSDDQSLPDSTTVVPMCTP